MSFPMGWVCFNFSKLCLLVYLSTKTCWGTFNGKPVNIVHIQSTKAFLYLKKNKQNTQSSGIFKEIISILKDFLHKYIDFPWMGVLAIVST